MKRCLLKITAFLFLFLYSWISDAQVTGVKYMLKYNDTTRLFDMNLVITGGSATTKAHRTQFNAAISFVIPNTDSIAIVQRFMPLQNNGEYNGTVPMEWLVSYRINSPAAQPQNNFYSIVPSLSPTSHYNNLNTNDTIKLFSVRVFRLDGSTVNPCADNIRLYVNGFDPHASDPGMYDTDASNGFTIGGISQVYTGNIITISPITLLPKPTLTFTGPNSICVGQTTSISPTTGGTWSSNNPSIATIHPNTGVISGVLQGIANFTYTSTAGCTSVSSMLVINPRPTVVINGSTSICIGSTSTLAPTVGGSWTSNNNAIAIVTNGGLITGVAEGATQFVFTETATGCSSLPTEALTVHPRPLSSYTGPTTICAGQNTNVSPTSGGTWSSSNPGIATITNRGDITGISAGKTQFIFTEVTTGCTSLPTDTLTVHQLPIITSNRDSINLNQIISLTPSTGGTWTSNNPDILEITGSSARGLKIGTATAYFTDATTGCRSVNKEIKVVNPMNTIVGYAFRDVNGNGLFDSSMDSPLPNCAITISGLNATYYTDPTGYYHISVPPGSYSATFKVPYGIWITNTKTRNINATGSTTYVLVGFNPCKSNT
jgi:uncharacterized protein YjdB